MCCNDYKKLSFSTKFNIKLYFQKICSSTLLHNYCATLIKDDVHSVLHIGSAHNKAGYKDCLNFTSFELLFI